MKKLALAIGFAAFIAFSSSGSALAAHRSDDYSGAAAIPDGRIAWSGGGAYGRVL